MAKVPKGSGCTAIALAMLTPPYPSSVNRCPERSTITPAAAGKKFRFTNAAGCAITIQPDASGAWTAGQIVYFRRVTGAGALTFNNTGITITGNAISGVLAGEEFALHQVAANTFDFI